MVPRNKFTLSPTDRQSLLWQRLYEHLNRMLAIRREENDFPRSEAETARIRGEIALLKELLDLNIDRLP